MVTGASRGIGLELARQCCRFGYDVVVASDSEAIHGAAQDLRGFGTDVEPVVADLSRPDGVESLWLVVEKTGRPVDALCVNAGVGVGGSFLTTSLPTEIAMIELNVVSTVHITKLALPAMVDRGRGRVLLTSSIAAASPAPFEAVYGATKAFVLSFAEAVRNELQDTGVTVTTLMPGPTDTNFFHRAGMDATRVARGQKDDPARVAEYGFDAMMAGRDHVVAGSFRNRLQASAARVLSEQAKAQVHRHMAEPLRGAR